MSQSGVILLVESSPARRHRDESTKAAIKLLKEYLARAQTPADTPNAVVAASSGSKRPRKEDGAPSEGAPQSRSAAAAASLAAVSAATGATRSQVAAAAAANAAAIIEAASVPPPEHAPSLFVVAQSLKRLFAGRATLKKTLKDRFGALVAYADPRRPHSVLTELFRRQPEPQRKRAHWDALLEEAMWLASDVRQEAIWRRAVAASLARDAVVAARAREARRAACGAESGQDVSLISFGAETGSGGEAPLASASSSAGALRSRALLAQAAVLHLLQQDDRVVSDDNGLLVPVWHALRAAVFASAATAPARHASAVQGAARLTELSPFCPLRSSALLSTAVPTKHALIPPPSLPVASACDAAMVVDTEGGSGAPAAMEPAANVPLPLPLLSSSAENIVAASASSVLMPSFLQVDAVASALTSAAHVWVRDGQGEPWLLPVGSDALAGCSLESANANSLDPSAATAAVLRAEASEASSLESGSVRLRWCQSATAARVVASWLCDAPAVIEGFSSSRGLGRTATAAAAIAAVGSQWRAAHASRPPLSIVVCDAAASPHWISALQSWCGRDHGADAPGASILLVSDAAAATAAVLALDAMASCRGPVRPLVAVVPTFAITEALGALLSGLARASSPTQALLGAFVFDQRGLFAHGVVALAADAPLGDSRSLRSVCPSLQAATAALADACATPDALRVLALHRSHMSSADVGGRAPPALRGCLLITALDIPISDASYLSSLMRWLCSFVAHPSTSGISPQAAAPSVVASEVGVRAWAVALQRLELCKLAGQSTSGGGVRLAAAVGSSGVALSAAPLVATVLGSSGAFAAEPSSTGIAAVSTVVDGAALTEAGASAMGGGAVTLADAVPSVGSSMSEHDASSAICSWVNKAVSLLYVPLVRREQRFADAAPLSALPANVSSAAGAAVFSHPPRLDRVVSVPLLQPQLRCQARLLRAHHASAVASGLPGAAAALLGIASGLHTRLVRSGGGPAAVASAMATAALGSAPFSAASSASASAVFMLRAIASLHYASQSASLGGSLLGGLASISGAEKKSAAPLCDSAVADALEVGVVLQGRRTWRADSGVAFVGCAPDSTAMPLVCMRAVAGLYTLLSPFASSGARALERAFKPRAVSFSFDMPGGVQVCGLWPDLEFAFSETWCSTDVHLCCVQLGHANVVLRVHSEACTTSGGVAGRKVHTLLSPCQWGSSNEEWRFSSFLSVRSIYLGDASGGIGGRKVVSVATRARESPPFHDGRDIATLSSLRSVTAAWSVLPVGWAWLHFAAPLPAIADLAPHTPAVSLRLSLHKTAPTAQSMELQSCKLRALSAVLDECSALGHRPLVLAHTAAAADLAQAYMCISHTPSVRLDVPLSGPSGGGWNRDAVLSLEASARMPGRLVVGVASVEPPPWVYALPSSLVPVAAETLVGPALNAQAVDVVIVMDSSPGTVPHPANAASTPATSLLEAVLSRLRAQRPLLVVRIVAVGGFEALGPPAPSKATPSQHLSAAAVVSATTAAAGGGDAGGGGSTAAPPTLGAPSGGGVALTLPLSTQALLSLTTLPGAVAGQNASVSPATEAFAALATLIRARLAAMASPRFLHERGSPAPLSPFLRHASSPAATALARKLSASEAMQLPTPWWYSCEANDDDEGVTDCPTGRSILHRTRPGVDSRYRRSLACPVASVVGILARHQDAGGLHFSHAWGPPHPDARCSVVAPPALACEHDAHSAARTLSSLVALTVPLDRVAQHPAQRALPKQLPPSVATAPCRDVPWRGPLFFRASGPQWGGRSGVQLQGGSTGGGASGASSSAARAAALPRLSAPVAAAAGVSLGMPPPQLCTAAAAFVGSSGRASGSAPTTIGAMPTDSGHVSVREPGSALQHPGSISFEISGMSAFLEDEFFDQAWGVAAAFSLEGGGAGSLARRLAAAAAIAFPSRSPGSARNERRSATLLLPPSTTAAALLPVSDPATTAASAAAAVTAAGAAVLEETAACGAVSPLRILSLRPLAVAAATRLSSALDSAVELREFSSQRCRLIGLQDVASSRALKRARLMCGAVGESRAAEELLSVARHEAAPVVVPATHAAAAAIASGSLAAASGSTVADWAPSEDVQLLRAVASFGSNWDLVRDAMRASSYTGGSPLLPPDMALGALLPRSPKLSLHLGTSRLRSGRSIRSCYDRFRRLLASARPMSLLASLPSSATSPLGVRVLLHTLPPPQLTVGAKRGRSGGVGLPAGVFVAPQVPTERVLAMRARTGVAPGWLSSAAGTGEQQPSGGGAARWAALTPLACGDAGLVTPSQARASLRLVDTFIAPAAQRRLLPVAQAAARDAANPAAAEATAALHPALFQPGLSADGTAVAVAAAEAAIARVGSRIEARDAAAGTGAGVGVARAASLLRGPSAVTATLGPTLQSLASARALGLTLPDGASIAASGIPRVSSSVQPLPPPLIAQAFMPRDHPYRERCPWTLGVKASVAATHAALAQAQAHALAQAAHAQKIAHAQAQQKAAAAMAAVTAATAAAHAAATAGGFGGNEALDAAFMAVARERLAVIAHLVSNFKGFAAPSESFTWLLRALSPGDKAHIVALFRHGSNDPRAAEARDAEVSSIIARCLQNSGVVGS